MWPSTIMRTLCSVQNAISIDVHTNKSPEMWTPRYSVKRTLGLAPTVSPPIQTYSYCRQFGTFLIHLLNIQQELEARYSAKSTLELLISLVATVTCLTREVIGHISSILTIGHTHTISLTPEKRTPHQSSHFLCSQGCQD